MSWKTDNSPNLSVSGNELSLVSEREAESKANAIWSEEAGSGINVWRFRQGFIE